MSQFNELSPAARQSVLEETAEFMQASYVNEDVKIVLEHLIRPVGPAEENTLLEQLQNAVELKTMVKEGIEEEDNDGSQFSYMSVGDDGVLNISHPGIEPRYVHVDDEHIERAEVTLEIEGGTVQVVFTDICESKLSDFLKRFNQ